MAPDFSSPDEPLSVGFVLLQRFTILPFSAFVDCLRLSADDGDRSQQIRCRWQFMSSGGQDVVSSSGATITGCGPLTAPERFDYIVVIGGVLGAAEEEDQQALDYLRLAAQCDVPLVGVCTGVFSLVKAGLMDGRRCCISWYHHADLVQRYPDIEPVADQLFLDDGNRLTCAGGVASADLAAYLVERHLGRLWAKKSLHIMLIDEPRPGQHPQPQPVVFSRVSDPLVRRAISIFEQHLGEVVTIERLAKRLHTSRRNIERHFREQFGVGPQKFARDLRLHYGCWMLNYTKHSITDIGERCGFADTAHFSRHFREVFGIPPSEVRRLSEDQRARLVDPFFLHVGQTSRALEIATPAQR